MAGDAGVSGDLERLNAWKEASEAGEFPEEIVGLTTEPDGFPLPSGSSTLDLDRIERFFKVTRPGPLRRLLRVLGWIDRRPGDIWPFPFAGFQPGQR